MPLFSAWKQELNYYSLYFQCQMIEAILKLNLFLQLIKYTEKYKVFSVGVKGEL